MRTFREFIDRHWTSCDELAAEIGIPASQVRHWKTRNVLPIPKLWLKVERAARRKGYKGDGMRLFAKIAENEVKGGATGEERGNGASLPQG